MPRGADTRSVAAAAAASAATALTALLAACSGEDAGGVVVPEFARTLPGETAFVVYGGEGALTADLRAAIEPRVREFGLQLEGGGGADRPLWGKFDGSHSGWASLAESRTFVTALARLGVAVDGVDGPDRPVSAVVFADLQQMVDHLGREADAVDTRVRMAIRSLGLGSLRSVIARVHPADDSGRYRVEGWLRASADDTSVAALLRNASGPGLLPAASGGSAVPDGSAAPDGSATLDGAAVPDGSATPDGSSTTSVSTKLELAFDTDVAGRLLDVLGSGEASMVQGLAGAMLDPIRRLVRESVRHLGGRVSLVINADRAVTAWSVTDLEGLAAVLGRYARSIDDDLWQLPGGQVVKLSRDRILVGAPGVDLGVDLDGSGGERGTVSAAGDSTVAPADFALRLRRGRLELDVRRVDAQTLQFEARW